MSTALPPAAALLLPLLLLAGAAAAATAATAAGSRQGDRGKGCDRSGPSHYFLPLVDRIHPATVKHVGWPASGFMLLRRPRMGDSTRSFTEAEPGWAPIPAGVPSGANITASNSVGDLKPSRDTPARCPLRSCRSELAQIRPSWHWKSMPESYLADANRRVTNQSRANADRREAMRKEDKRNEGTPCAWLQRLSRRAILTNPDQGRGRPAQRDAAPIRLEG